MDRPYTYLIRLNMNINILSAVLGISLALGKEIMRVNDATFSLPENNRKRWAQMRSWVASNLNQVGGF